MTKLSEDRLVVVVQPQETLVIVENGQGPQGPIGPQGPKGDTGEAGQDAEWGLITGVLSNQTDLKQSLDEKANTSSLGSAAFVDTTVFATASQGAMADSAVQPDALNTALAGKLDTTGTAADSSKLGGQLPSYYATAAQIGDIATALDLINGEVI